MSLHISSLADLCVNGLYAPENAANRELVAAYSHAIAQFGEQPGRGALEIALAAVRHPSDLVQFIAVWCLGNAAYSYEAEQQFCMLLLACKACLLTQSVTALRKCCACLADCTIRMPTEKACTAYDALAGGIANVAGSDTVSWEHLVSSVFDKDYVLSQFADGQVAHLAERGHSALDIASGRGFTSSPNHYIEHAKLTSTLLAYCEDILHALNAETQCSVKLNLFDFLRHVASHINGLVRECLAKRIDVPRATKVYQLLYQLSSGRFADTALLDHIMNLLVEQDTFEAASQALLPIVESSGLDLTHAAQIAAALVSSFSADGFNPLRDLIERVDIDTVDSQDYSLVCLVSELMTEYGDSLEYSYADMYEVLKRAMLEFMLRPGLLQMPLAFIASGYWLERLEAGVGRGDIHHDSLLILRSTAGRLSCSVAGFDDELSDEWNARADAKAMFHELWENIYYTFPSDYVAIISSLLQEAQTGNSQSLDAALLLQSAVPDTRINDLSGVAQQLTSEKVLWLATQPDGQPQLLAHLVDFATQRLSIIPNDSIGQIYHLFVMCLSSERLSFAASSALLAMAQNHHLTRDRATELAHVTQQMRDADAQANVVQAIAISICREREEQFATRTLAQLIQMIDMPPSARRVCACLPQMSSPFEAAEPGHEGARLLLEVIMARISPWWSNAELLDSAVDTIIDMAKCPLFSDNQIYNAGNALEQLLQQTSIEGRLAALLRGATMLIYDKDILQAHEQMLAACLHVGVRHDSETLTQTLLYGLALVNAMTAQPLLGSLLMECEFALTASTADGAAADPLVVDTASRLVTAICTTHADIFSLSDKTASLALQLAISLVRAFGRYGGGNVAAAEHVAAALFRLSRAASAALRPALTEQGYIASAIRFALKARHATELLRELRVLTT